MRDYEHLYATTLHQKLKEKIIGKIYVKITTEDVLHIDITGKGNLKFNIDFDKFSQRFMDGWSTDLAANDVVNAYKKKILETFFVQ